MQTGLHRNTISKVYRQLETDGVVEAMAGSGIYVRDQRLVRPRPRPTSATAASPMDREVRKCVDGLLNAGCTATNPGAARRSTAPLRRKYW